MRSVALLMPSPVRPCRVINEMRLRFPRSFREVNEQPRKSPSFHVSNGTRLAVQGVIREVLSQSRKHIELLRGCQAQILCQLAEHQCTKTEEPGYIVRGQCGRFGNIDRLHRSIGVVGKAVKNAVCAAVAVFP